MAGMQHDQSHAGQYTCLYPVDNGVSDTSMGTMAPPEQDIGLRQHSFSQTVFRFLKRRRAYREIIMLARRQPTPDEYRQDRCGAPFHFPVRE